MKPETYAVPVLRTKPVYVDFTPAARKCLRWAADRVGLKPADLSEKWSKKADIMLARQLALWAMFAAHVPANMIAKTLNATRPAVHKERVRILKREDERSKIFDEAAEVGRSMRPKCSI